LLPYEEEAKNHVQKLGTKAIEVRLRYLFSSHKINVRCLAVFVAAEELPALTAISTGYRPSFLLLRHSNTVQGLM
jgi:hypothetical protein